MRTIKIYENGQEVYVGTCPVNMAILKGRIFGDFQHVGKNGIKFVLQISNGKNRETGEWNKSTFADCTAFGSYSTKILKDYGPKDEIWLIGKYYSKPHDGKFYKGFYIHGIIPRPNTANQGIYQESGQQRRFSNKNSWENAITDDYLPF